MGQGGSGEGGATMGQGGSGEGGATVGQGGSGTCAGPVPGTRSTNPLFTDEYTADPAPMVSNCTFYITCGHDEGNDTQFRINEWFVLKSTDMVNWTKQIALTLGDFAWADANAWASQMVERDGRFYWYVPVNKRGSGMAIGVAVANSPEGPFEDAIGAPLVDDDIEMDNMGFAEPGETPYTIDPTVFVDDDGQAYLYYGGYWRMVVARLGDDMISIEGTMEESTPQSYWEAPFIFKENGTYYMLYAAGENPAPIDYATSNSPMGPWQRRGTVLEPLPSAPGQHAATSHPGAAKFGDQWFFVYHVSDGPNNGGTYRREVAVEKMEFNADGSIQVISPSDGIQF